MPDKVLLVVENLAAADTARPQLPKNWFVVTPYLAMPCRGFNVVVVPRDIVDGRYRSRDLSTAVQQWYQEAVVTAMLPGCRILKT